MLFAEMKFLPDLWASALDEVLAIGIRRLVVDDELGDLVGPIIATVASRSAEGAIDPAGVSFTGVSLSALEDPLQGIIQDSPIGVELRYEPI
jgi:hypothetical protein